MLIDLYLWLRVKFSAPEHVFYWKKGAAAWLLKSEHDLTIIKNHAYFVRVLRSFILPFFLMWKSLFSHRSMYQNSYRSCLNCTHRAIETTFPPVNVSKLPVVVSELYTSGHRDNFIQESSLGNVISMTCFILFIYLCIYSQEENSSNLAAKPVLGLEIPKVKIHHTYLLFIQLPGVIHVWSVVWTRWWRKVIHRWDPRGFVLTMRLIVFVPQAYIIRFLSWRKKGVDSSWNDAIFGVKISRHWMHEYDLVNKSITEPLVQRNLSSYWISPRIKKNIKT